MCVPMCVHVWWACLRSALWLKFRDTIHFCHLWWLCCTLGLQNLFILWLKVGIVGPLNFSPLPTPMLSELRVHLYFWSLCFLPSYFLQLCCSSFSYLFVFIYSIWKNSLLKDIFHSLLHWLQSFFKLSLDCYS